MRHHHFHAGVHDRLQAHGDLRAQARDLLIDGALHPRFSENGASLHVRNGVGVTDADTAWFAISDEPVSFGRFARLFRDYLNCPNALFLDGAVSSLWDRPAGRRDAYPSLGPLIAVFSEPSAPRP